MEARHQPALQGRAALGPRARAARVIEAACPSTLQARMASGPGAGA